MVRRVTLEILVDFAVALLALTQAQCAHLPLQSLLGGCHGGCSVVSHDLDLTDGKPVVAVAIRGPSGGSWRQEAHDVDIHMNPRVARRGVRPPLRCEVCARQKNDALAPLSSDCTSHFLGDILGV